MQVKGTAVKTIPEFIKSKHPDKYNGWFQQLPEKSKAIFQKGVAAPNWYPILDAIITPTTLMSTILYGNERDGAWECGRYSAEIALNGIYKLYVKMSSPGHIIDRAGRVLQAYYDPSEITVVGKTDKSVTLHLTKFPEPHKVVEYRLAGWMERALEISGCRNIRIDIPKSLTKGDTISEFSITWE